MTIRKKLQRIVFVLKNTDTVYDTYKTHDREHKCLLESKAMFDEFEWEWSCKHNDSHPIFKIGSALELADLHKVQLARGTCYGDCVAYISREDWTSPIDTTVSQHELGVWCVRPWDEIDSIYGYGHTACEAIVRCLTFARRAGVIE